MNINIQQEKNEKLNEYYKLKSMYETQFEKEKRKIINTPNLSSREKRKLFKEFKPKCIFCKRPVGNIFHVLRDNASDSRKFSARCGDIASPCAFQYVIQVEDCNLYTNYISFFENEIITLKNKVIHYKNMLLFGYISNQQVVEEFDKLKETISDSSTMLEYFLNQYNEIVNNKNKNENISKLKMDIYNTYINNIKISMKEFDRTNELQYVRDAVDIYVNILTQKLKELSQLEYSKSFVEYNSDTNTYHLIQEKVDISNLEYDYNVEVLEENLSDKIVKSKKTTDKKAPTKPKILLVESSEGSLKKPETPEYSSPESPQYAAPQSREYSAEEVL